MRRAEAFNRTHRPVPREALTADGHCDAAAIAERGMDENERGHHPEALRLYEASLACEPQPHIIRLAFYAACEAGDAARARVHYQELPVESDKRELYRQACATYGVDPAP